jgi:putative superfamily III holin-X
MSRDVQSIEATGVTALLGRLVQNLGNLVADHLALARIEIGEDIRTFAARLGTVALFVPLVLAGCALLLGALAVFLSPWLTLAGALLVVGGASFAAGGVGLKVAIGRLRVPDKVDEIVAGVKAEALASVTSTLTAIERRADAVEAIGR